MDIDLVLLKKDAKERLLYFLHRPLMFIQSAERNQIVYFIHGWEFALINCNLTLNIKNYLEETYNIFGGAQGWPEAIERYASLKKIDWFDAFKELVLLVLDETQFSE